MKISTLLTENSNSEAQFKSDLNAYLVRLKANNIPSIDTSILVGELNDMGYSTTPESLVDVLRNSKYVTNASIDEIVIAGAPTAKAADAEAEQNKKTVKSLAKKATTKRIS